jgi:hypothetical protein
MRTGLVLPYMLGLDVISFSKHIFVVFSVYWLSTKKKKKKLGRRCGTLFLSFDSFLDVACVFA